MSGSSARSVVELVQVLRRVARLVVVAPRRVASAAGVAGREGRRWERGHSSGSSRLAVGAGSLAVALLAADAFNGIVSIRLFFFLIIFRVA